MSDTKPPPWSEEAERALLGALLLGTEPSLEALRKIAWLDAQYFYSEKHQVIYRAIRAVDAKRELVQLTTVSEALQAASKLGAAGGPAYVAGLIDELPQPAGAESNARIIQEHYGRRKLQELGGELQRCVMAGDLSPADMLNAVRDRVDTIEAGLHLDTEAATLAEYEQAFFARLDQDRKRPAIASPWNSLNEQLGKGFTQGLYMLAATPGAGKTTLCLHLAHYLAMQQVPVIFAALEMPRDHLIKRLLAHHTDTTWSELLIPGDLAPEKIQALHDAYTQLKGDAGDFLELHECAPAERPHVGGWLEHKVRRIRDRHKRPPFVIVDYLQLLAPPEEWKGDRRNAVGHNAYLLKALSTSLDCTVFAISSISRAHYEKEADATSATPDHTKLLGVFKESGDVDYSMDVGLVLQQEPQSQRFTITVCKNRFGPSGGVVKLEGNLATGVFTEPSFSEYH